MDFRATKDEHEREEEEAERLVRPSPKLKPPRHDKRREEMRPDSDPDVESDPDLKGDPDMSLNYKTIGGSLTQRVALRFAKEELVTVRLKAEPEKRPVQVTEQTLRENAAKYELVEKEEDEPSAPTQPEQPTTDKPSPVKPDEAAGESKWTQARGTLDEMAQHDAEFAAILKDFTRPGTSVYQMAEGNPKLPAEKFLRGRTPPKGIKTVGDLLNAMRAKAPPKQQKKRKPDQAEGQAGGAGTPEAFAKAVAEAMKQALPEILKALQQGGQKEEPQKPQMEEPEKVEPGESGETDEARGQFKEPSTEELETAKAQAGKTTWKEPDLVEESGELERTAKELGINFKELKRAAQNAQLEDLDDAVWSELENTDSYDTDTAEKAIELAKEYDRDISRVMQGMGGTLPAPLVLIREGKPPYLVGGNTRLMAARAFGAKPKILAIHQSSTSTKKKSPEDREFEYEQKREQREQRREQSLLATQLIMDTFPPSVAVDLLSKNLHPEDLQTIATEYHQAKSRDIEPPLLSKFVREQAASYTTDPDSVATPKTWEQRVDGKLVEVPFEDLEPDKKAEAYRKHQLRTVAHSLAAETQITKTLKKKSGAPPRLARHLAQFMLKSSPNEDPERQAERAKKTARALFDHSLLSGEVERLPDGAIKKILKAIDDPAAQKVAVGYFQGQDYIAAREKFLDDNSPDSISERDDPGKLARQFRAASEFFESRDRRYPKGSQDDLHVGDLFRARVLKQLKTLTPDKYPLVQEQLDAFDRQAYDADLRKFRKHHDSYYKQVRQAEAERKKALADYGKKVWEALDTKVPLVPPEPKRPMSVGERLVEAGVAEPSQWDIDSRSKDFKEYQQARQAHEEAFKEEKAAWDQKYADWKGIYEQGLASVVVPPPPLEAVLQKKGFVEPVEPRKPMRYDLLANPSEARKLYNEHLNRVGSVQTPSARVLGRYLYSSYPSGWTMDQSSDRAARHRQAVYWGVEPYQPGVAPYPQWHQGHTRDYTDADYAIVLKEAREWLKAPVLSTSMEGVPKDTQLRAALDLAIWTCDGGKYNHSFHAEVYKNLLARLAGVSQEDTLLTIASEKKSTSIYGLTGREVSMKASDEIRSFAARIAGDHPELSFDLITLAEKVAGQVPPQFLEHQKKKKKDDDGDDDKEQKKEASVAAAKYQSLRSLVIRTAHTAGADARKAFQPVLEALKG